MRIKREALRNGARILVALGACRLDVATAAASPFEDVTAVPEPGSLAIFALALLGIWAVKRHSDDRNKK